MEILPSTRSEVRVRRSDIPERRALHSRFVRSVRPTATNHSWAMPHRIQTRTPPIRHLGRFSISIRQATQACGEYVTSLEEEARECHNSRQSKLTWGTAKRAHAFNELYTIGQDYTSWISAQLRRLSCHVALHNTYDRDASCCESGRSGNEASGAYRNNGS